MEAARYANGEPRRIGDRRGNGQGHRWVRPKAGLEARSNYTESEKSKMVTTTHDPRLGGRPRLIAALGGTAPEHASQREFDLVPG
jgi:hypothetical protein